MTQLTERLEQLKTKMLEMSSLVESGIQCSISAAVQRDQDAAEAVFKYETRINLIDLEIDRLVVDLLALHQPMAIDLRFVIAALKINTNLERMGDLSVNIAHSARSLIDGSTDTPMIDIPLIAGLVESMVRKRMDAFIQSDVDLARNVLSTDAAVDTLRTICYHQLISFMEKDPTSIKQALNLLDVTRYLERLGDHATNIAEIVLFYVKESRSGIVAARPSTKRLSFREATSVYVFTVGTIG